jgi:hypothetical protein
MLPFHSTLFTLPPPHTSLHILYGAMPSQAEELGHHNELLLMLPFHSTWAVDIPYTTHMSRPLSGAVPSQAEELGHLEERLIVLSDVWLDKRETLDALGTVFAGGKGDRHRQCNGMLALPSRCISLGGTCCIYTLLHRCSGLIAQEPQ